MAFKTSSDATFKFFGLGSARAECSEVKWLLVDHVWTNPMLEGCCPTYKTSRTAGLKNWICPSMPQMEATVLMQPRASSQESTLGWLHVFPLPLTPFPVKQLPIKDHQSHKKKIPHMTQIYFYLPWNCITQINAFNSSCSYANTCFIIQLLFFRSH